MLKIERDLINSINSILGKVFPDARIDPSDVYLDAPKEKRFGDYSTNIAMRISKLIKKPPMDAAAIVAAEIKNSAECSETIESVKIEKPGFINLYLKDGAVPSELKEILEAGDKFGGSSAGNGRKAQIEFVSANPTGPLTVAHGRQAAIGDSLARILGFCGYKVTREYYINDEGVQIQALGKSVKARLMELLGAKSDFPENGYKGQYVYDVAKRIKDSAADQDLSAVSDDFFMEEACEDIMRTIIRDLEDFGVHFDEWFSQKSLARTGKIEKTLDALRKKGFLFEQEGATWFRSTQFKDDKDRVVIKSDGSYTYVTPDMAYHREKFEKGYDKIIDILGPDHHGYILRIKAACQALGYDAGKLHIMIAQLVTLYRSGNLVRMSTREGEFITLREVMDEIGKDAARFFFIMRKVESHLDFDLELAKQKTMDNPVYYIQYAHARISSIIAFRGDEKTGMDNLSLLDKTEELDLIKKLAQYPKAIINAGENLEPYTLLAYLQELAGAFHSYYNSHRIVTEDSLLTEARLSLAKAVKTVLSSGLGLLGVSAPEKM
ncbi:MAG: arginine--tRNA ligase [Candidatus Omnitrophota bacterium]